MPSYALIVREYFPAREAGARVSLVLMATVLGMALGGWLSGEIYDLTGSYQAAFLNGIAWNLRQHGDRVLAAAGPDAPGAQPRHLMPRRQPVVMRLRRWTLTPPQNGSSRSTA